MEVKRRRYPLSNIFSFCTICTSIFSITYVNYKHMRMVSIESTVNAQKLSPNDYSSDCFKARQDSVPKSRYGKLNYPFINLGFPKIGSSSIHSFFGCAGYRSSHYRCSPTMKCSECIRQSIQSGLKPLHNCILAEVYAQIDDGRSNFPQIDYLNEIIDGYPNATFILVFRNMNSWYESLSKWTRNGTRMVHDLMQSNIQGLPSGIGRDVQEFSEWFCSHVTRVRDTIARSSTHNTLVEIDLDDTVKTRQQMSDIFSVDANCWGRANVNLDIHTNLDGENIVSREGQSKWFLLGDKMIKGKDGTKRNRNYTGQQFLNYL